MYSSAHATTPSRSTGLALLVAFASLLREALAAYREVSGDRHPNTLASINSMGLLLQAQGKLAEAEPLYREAVTVAREVLGTAHPWTKGFINNLAAILKQQGKAEEANTLVRM